MKMLAERTNAAAGEKPDAAGDGEEGNAAATGSGRQQLIEYSLEIDDDDDDDGSVDGDVDGDGDGDDEEGGVEDGDGDADL